MEYNSFNQNTNFSNKISELFENKDIYDDNLFENIDNIHQMNNNVFSNLTKLFSDEHERIFSKFIPNTSIIDIMNKMNNDVVQTEYNSDKYLEELENENDKEKAEIKEKLENKTNIDYDSFIENIRKLRLYYSKINISTFQLEKEIIEILNKYDKCYSKMKKIYDNLKDFEDIEEHVKTIDKEIIDYMTNFFKKQELDVKMSTYKNNMKEINYLKELLNKLNSISYTPYCQICMTKIIDTVVIPCGHTFCQNCVDKSDKCCFICRQDIKNTSKLFIS